MRDRPAMATLCGLLAAMALGVAPLLLSALEQEDALAPVGPLAAPSASAEVAQSQFDIGYTYRGTVECEGYSCAPILFTPDGGRYFQRFNGWNAGEEDVYTFNLPARVTVELAEGSGNAILELGGNHNYSQPTDSEVTVGARGDLGTTTLRWISGDRSYLGSWRVTIRSIGCPEPKPTCEGDCQHITISCGVENCNCQVEPCGCRNSWAVISDDSTPDDLPAVRADIKFPAPTTMFLDIALGAFDSPDHLLLAGGRYPPDTQSRYQVHIGGTSEHGMRWISKGGRGAGRFWAVMGPYNPPFPWRSVMIVVLLLACSCCWCCYLYWTRRPASLTGPVQSGEVQM